MTNQKPFFKIGIEIETAINRSVPHLSEIEIGDYHNGYSFGIDDFIVEHDSSIHTEKIGFKPCEFILEAQKNNQFKKKIKEFQDFISNQGEYCLSDTLEFNTSMGSHVHFSLLDKKHTFKHKIPQQILIKTRKKFLRMIKESNISSKEFIITQYKRRYSHILNKNDIESIFRDDSDRHREFNFSSETNLKGFEWRSPNMAFIKTWDEFNEFINILYECVYFLCKKALCFSVVTHYRKQLLNKDDKSQIEYSIEEAKELKEVLVYPQVYKKEIESQVYGYGLKDEDVTAEKHTIKKNHTIKIRRVIIEV